MMIHKVHPIAARNQPNCPPTPHMSDEPKRIWSQSLCRLASADCAIISASPSPLSQTNDGRRCHAAADVTGCRGNPRSAVTLGKRRGSSSVYVCLCMRVCGCVQKATASLFFFIIPSLYFIVDRLLCITAVYIH